MEIIVGYVSTVLEIFVLHRAQEHCSLRNNNELKMHLQLSRTDLEKLVFRLSTRYKPIDNDHAVHPLTQKKDLRKKHQFSRGKSRYAFDKNNGKHPGMFTVPRDLGVDLIYFSNETAYFCLI